MRIIATCCNCQRDLLLSQLVEGPGLSGRCPWCGTLLAPHYSLLLAETVRPRRARWRRAGAGPRAAGRGMGQAPHSARVDP
jgi:hypothetical protein